VTIETDYRQISFWHASVPGDLTPRAALPGDADADVVIVGAGFTGLWTAYYLAKADPSLRVVVLEREIAGFGASGRNGGWVVGELAAPLPAIARAAGADAAVAMARAMHATVDEVGAVAAAEGIDCHYHKGGALQFAINRAQLERMDSYLETVRRFGFGDDDYRRLSARETTARLNATGVHAGMLSAHCAVIHPARLARGLAGVVERLGVRVYEQTAVQRLELGGVVTDRGRVRAEVVVRATEAYTPEVSGQERALVPVGNSMIATEPLSSSTWDEIGLAQREAFEDCRHLIFYGQRTIDDRITFGGLSVPYRYGSRIDHAQFVNAPVHERLRRTLVGLFPVLADVNVTHRWGGVLAIPRDWYPSVGLDRETGLAWAGGYVGAGVAAANLAGRTLADLITKQETDLVRLPWVGHRSPDWEDEPARWAGLAAASTVFELVDRAELLTGRRQRWGDAIIRRLMG
jgi:glycine/D-amino acid oxidase-like deaminating enzyme